MTRILFAVVAKVNKAWNKVEFSRSQENPYYDSFYLYNFPLSILNTLKDIILEANAVQWPQAFMSSCPRPKAATLVAVCPLGKLLHFSEPQCSHHPPGVPVVQMPQDGVRIKLENAYKVVRLAAGTWSLLLAVIGVIWLLF